MKNKTLNLVVKILVPFFWIGVWQLISMLVNNSYFVPSVYDTFLKLIDIVFSVSFLKIASLTLLRVATGFALGVVFAVILSFLCHKFPIIYEIIYPIISIIKSTPVASFIIILWILLKGDVLVIFIAFLMVMPIIWQNLMDGYKSIKTELIEVAEVYEFSLAKRLKLIVFPALLKYFIPASITSISLAWKSEIAGEIIAYTKNSIGEKINDAKAGFDTPSVFAWTVIIIIFSLLLEKLVKLLLLKFNKATEGE